MKKRFEQIVEYIKLISSADDYIIQWYAKDSALTRFADNMVTQNVDIFSEKVELTSYFDGKKASLETANLDKDGLTRLVKKCELTAKNSIKDKEYMPTLAQTDQKIINDIDPAVIDMGSRQRAKIAKYAIERSQKEDAIAAGIVQKGINFLGIATKNGAHKFYAKTRAEYKNTIDINNHKGAAWESDFKLDRINAEAIFEEALKDARLLNQRVELEPGRYKVLIGARAARHLFSMMSYYGLNRRAVDEGYSAFTGKIGEKIADERINIYTDPNDKKAPAAPFNYEGQPIEKRHIIKNGVLESIPCSRFWAKENDIDAWSIGNIIFAGGEKSEAKLLASIDRGFYIKEFWYIRMVKMNDLTLTGMTRNGFFYIEDGLLVSGATHFRWNDSPLSMLNRIVELGQGSGNIPEWGRAIFAPAMIVDDFYLSSKTLF